MKSQLSVMLLMAFAAMLTLVGCQDVVHPGGNVIVSVDPTGVELFVNTQQQYDATVTGTFNTVVSPAVTWSTDGGEIDINGLYTAPDSAGTYHVTATSVADPQASSTVEVVVLPQVAQGTFAISPTSVTIDVNATQQFTPIYGGLAPGVTWEVEEVGGGTIDTEGLYTAPDVAGTYHVKGTSTADPTLSATAEITVNPVVVVSVLPASVSIYIGVQQQFEATVTGTDNTAVTWGADGGSVDGNGLYTAPGTAGTYHVTATSVADPSKSFTAEVIVSLRPVQTGISISPTTVILENGRCDTDDSDARCLQFDTNPKTQQFTAILLNLAPGVTWAVDEGTAGGTITSDGLYTAPANVGTYHVTVTSIADPTKSATAIVTVVPHIIISITPKTVHLRPGGTKRFHYHLMGATINTVTWSVVEANGGTVTDTGLYTAPATPGTYHVSVASTQNPTKKELATVHVDAPR